MIRAAGTEDVESVRGLLLECRLPIDGVPEQLESLFVAVVGGRIVGVARIAGSRHEGTLARDPGIRHGQSAHPRGAMPT